MMIVFALANACIQYRSGSATTRTMMTRATFSGPQGTREYVAYRPASYPEDRAQRSLVVMLHGCTQNADDFARGTRMNAAADAHGFMVLYPEQPASAHPQKCWNWYAAEQVTRGHGEAALLAAMIDSVAFAEGVVPSRIALVGMSAGAAMAANLAVAYPERCGALALHSGIPALAATDVNAALHAMRTGDANGEQLGKAALDAMGSRAKPIPVIAMHGATDKVVAPANLHATVRQWQVVNGAHGNADVAEHLFDGVGHAWSGGSAEGTYTAPTGPDATALVIAFLAQHDVIRR